MTTDTERAKLSFEQVEDCFPEGSGSDEYGQCIVSAQWLHDFARNIQNAAALLAEDKAGGYGWQPIETVEEVPELPGSTQVLVFSTNQITSIQPLVLVRELFEISKTDQDDDCLFTNWMPLPDAPKEPGA